MARRRIDIDPDDFNFVYAPTDPDSLHEVGLRLTRTAAIGKPVPYSDLVRDVVFKLPNVHRGEPFSIDVHNWSGLDRAIVGDYLGYLAVNTYAEHGFMVSAFAVDGHEMRPSDGFYSLAGELGAFKGSSDTAKERFWVEQMNLGKAHYAG